jgi:hypothetical protein
VTPGHQRETPLKLFSNYAVRRKTEYSVDQKLDPIQNLIWIDDRRDDGLSLIVEIQGIFSEDGKEKSNPIKVN